MPSLIFNNVSFSFSMPLLQSVSFECSPAERICIVGPNGAGKTTLLRLASGELKPDGGTITGLGASMPALEPKMTVGEILNHATRTTRKLLQQFNTLSAKLASGDPDIYTEYDRVLNRLSAIDGWSLYTLISSTLAGVNLATIANQPDRLVDSLSPGQQGRLQLVAAILARPETLILDEPTNHLDTQGVRFLVELVHRWSGSVLFASHDRAFINAVATSILDLDTTAWRAVALATGTPLNNGVYKNRGNYQDYLAAKRLAQQRHVELHQQQQSEKRRLERHKEASTVVGHAKFKPRTETRSAKKFYADRAQQASTRRIINDEKRLESLRAIEVRKPRTPSFSFPLPTAITNHGLVVSVNHAAVPGRLAPVSFELSAGEKLLITGSNGVGKSTLLRWLATGIAPTEYASGEVFCAAHSAYLPQELPQADSDATIGEAGKGFINPKFWATPFNQLSDGNKRRTQLAQLLNNREHSLEILLLDEPTNFLDLAAIETLESSILDWSGTVIIVSHDHWLHDKWPYARLHLDSISA